MEQILLRVWRGQRGCSRADAPLRTHHEPAISCSTDRDVYHYTMAAYCRRALASARPDFWLLRLDSNQNELINSQPCCRYITKEQYYKERRRDSDPRLNRLWACCLSLRRHRYMSSGRDALRVMPVEKYSRRDSNPDRTVISRGH